MKQVCLDFSTVSEDCIDTDDILNAEVYMETLANKLGMQVSAV